MPLKVQLTYFRQTGKFLATAETVVSTDALVQIWERIDDLRRLGQLPGIRAGAGRDLCILVNVPDHPQRVLHLVMPPFVDDDDVTPSRVSTQMEPLVRVPLAEMPRTTTRDVVRHDDSAASDEEVTPVEIPLPRPPSEPER